MVSLAYEMTLGNGLGDIVIVRGQVNYVFCNGVLSKHDENVAWTNTLFDNDFCALALPVEGYKSTS